MPRSIHVSAVALAACFVLFSFVSAEHIEFDVWHRLGSDADAEENSKWKPAGTLSGEVDTGALVDAATAALRGGGGRISPPPKSASPVLTLVRDAENAITVEEAQKAAERGQGYSIKLKRKLDRSSAMSSKKTKNNNVALFTSAPPHCAAAALSGALPLKLDGSLPRSFSSSNGEGGGGIRVTGVSFDFYGGGCNKQGAKQLQTKQRVPIWLPAAAPPLLPPPPPPAAAKKAAAAAALAQAQAEAARRRAANGDKGGKEDGDAPPPVEDNRTWLQKNWVYALPMAMMAMNVMNAAAGPPPQQPRQRGPGGAGSVAAAGASAAAVVAAGRPGGGGGGVARSG